MTFPIDIYAAQALHGFVYGMLVFLVASGLTLVLGMMGVLNLAHASFYMLGAYFAYSVTIYSGSFWLSLFISPLLVGGLGLLIERFLIRKTYKGGHQLQLLLTFGLFFILNEFVRIAWGSGLLTVETPSILAGSIAFIGGRTYPVYRLFILGFAVLVLSGMALMLARTRVGIIIRAAVSDAEMVEALGNNVPIVFLLVFGGGAALAALAGVVAAPFLSVYLNMGGEALMDCFVVIVVGGFGSLRGALIASLMIGQLQSFGILWIPQLAMVFQFLLMTLILIVKPTGLFGEKE
jgi:branched-chain amino acid transport system permease protein